ncbi:MAG: TldD/PmbA family protein [Syntrophorhabdaceae bacterium]|nr:TldD/PmbA family protein [Syntrophorhabdaceae bacterium]
MFNGEMVLKKLVEGGGLFADVFFESRRFTHIHFESSRPERIEKGLDRGVGLRIVVPWKTYFASTNSLDERDLFDIASDLSKLAKKARNPSPLNMVEINSSYPFSIKVDPEDIDIANKLQMVKTIDKMARDMEKRIKQVRVIYRDTKQSISIYREDGMLIKDERCHVILNILVIGEKDGDIQTAYESIGGFYGYDFFKDETIENMVGITVKRLTGLLDAVEAPMGTKTVVLSSEAGGTMIHEAIGHGLEADLAMEGLSCYKGMLGEKVASELITVVDDGTIPHMRGTYAFDDEGSKSEKTVLVEKGILKNYLWDRFYGLKHNRPSTGNGRRESYRYRPIPRMSNTMILSGKDDPERIIASVDDGVYVVKMGGGQVDTVRGDFVFEIQEGYMIEKGRIGPMVKNATIMGNGPKILREIDMVGNDLGFGIGTCGKDGQGVPVSDAQPTLRIPEIIVGGRKEGS